jgi:hypothetical protein
MLVFFLLDLDFFRQTAELMNGVLNLVLGFHALPTIHPGNPLQSPAGAMGDGGDHVQIPQKLGHYGGRGMRLDLLLGFQKQFGLLQNPLSYTAASLAPRGIELAGLAHREAVHRQRLRHALTVLATRTRHRRQELHRRLRRDFALAHLLLHTFGKQFHQSQTTRHPTHTAIQPSCQLLHAVTEALLQFGQQPAFFQGALALRKTQAAVQHHGFGLPHRPHHRFHRVPPQLLQGRDPLVAVNDQVAILLVGYSHHHDGRLLTRGRQRS